MGRLKECYARGKKGEEKFIACMLGAYPNIEFVPTSEEDNIFRHQDTRLKYDDGREYTFDVKSMRPRDYYMRYAELRNVEGKRGSLYGEQDYFAFEMPSEWWIVRREDLRIFIESRVKDRKIYDIKVPYKPYSRRLYGRKDIMIPFLMSDIEGLCVRIPVKNVA